MRSIFVNQSPKVVCKSKIWLGITRISALMALENPVVQTSSNRMLRYDMSELREMGRGVEMQAAEAAEMNRSVSLRRVKTWPQLMCCALI